MPGVNCAEIAARRIAESCKGSTLLTNPYGCVQSQGDTQITLKILAGLLANPNVHSVLIVGLGCETMQKDMYLAAVEALRSRGFGSTKFPICPEGSVLPAQHEILDGGEYLASAPAPARTLPESASP